MTLQIRRNLRFLPAACLVMAVGLFISLAATADPGPALTIGVGRDFFDGPDSRAFLHGSTHTWEGLTYLDSHLTARPWLAESWHSLDDCRTWVFRLRKDVMFHDGTKLTAGHAKTAILRIARNPRYDPAACTGTWKHWRHPGPWNCGFIFPNLFPLFPMPFPTIPALFSIRKDLMKTGGSLN